MKGFLTIVGLVLISTLYSQEIITGLQYNEAIRYEIKKQNADTEPILKTDEVPSVLTLPFFDDFTNYSLFPIESLWIGHSAFINRDFPLNATNVGAATFDAIDENGGIYSNADWIPFMADVLTSRPIRLDSVFDPVVRKIGPEDSLYFSFYYQPQGVGDDPESWDTLILEFARQGDTVFSHLDSVLVTADVYLDHPNDTLWPLDTLWAPESMGCNPEIYMINYQVLGWNDLLTVPCDSVFAPDTIWDKVWYSEGMKLQEFKELYGRDFVQVMLPLYNDPGDSVYFYESFQFRFRNYASIANDIIPSWRSNTDHWNVDWVYLNYNRNAGDTTYRVLTFSERAPSFLKDYQAMPYRQYRAGSVTDLLKQQFNMYITNLDDVEHNTSYEYKVEQVNGNFNYGYYGGVCNLLPFDFFGFQNCNSSCGAAHACPPVNSAFNYDFTRDTTSYKITHYISDSSDADILVDSTIFYQGFYNYYAYDDGTPEFGYGIEPAGGKVAYQFNLSVFDTLWGVQMYFNHTENASNEIFFNMIIWQDNNGRPGEELYRSPSVKPKWEDRLYQFYPYMLDEPIMLTGTFYVGWQQQASGSLNIGLDANNNNGSKIFFTGGIDWLHSNAKGSLLIRPIVGQNMILDIEEEKALNSSTLNLYPNPAKQYFRIDQSTHPLDRSAMIYIYNIYGALVQQQLFNDENVDISKLPPGMYIVKVDNLGKVRTAKLLINQ